MGSRPCAPYAEPQYHTLRGPLALGAPGTEGGVLKLDGTFGLHPSLTNLHALYQARELAVLHAVATPYRERSHFDAQKVLEAGKLTPAATDGGWLNRALAAMHGAGDARGAVALNDTVPLVLRGDVAGEHVGAVAIAERRRGSARARAAVVREPSIRRSLRS